MKTKIIKSLGIKILYTGKPTKFLCKNITTCDWRKELVNDSLFRSSSAILKKDLSLRCLVSGFSLVDI